MSAIKVVSVHKPHRAAMSASVVLLVGMGVTVRQANDAALVALGEKRGRIFGTNLGMLDEDRPVLPGHLTVKVYRD